MKKDEIQLILDAKHLHAARSHVDRAILQLLFDSKEAGTSPDMAKKLPFDPKKKIEKIMVSDSLVLDLIIRGRK